LLPNWFSLLSEAHHHPVVSSPPTFLSLSLWFSSGCEILSFSLCVILSLFVFYGVCDWFS
jgi:hypothetical protein